MRFDVLGRQKSQVQVWGGDIKTDKEVITSNTSNTLYGPDNQSIIDKSTLQSMGFWGTGVDNNGNTLEKPTFGPSEYTYKGGDKKD